MLHYHILSDGQRKILPKIRLLKEEGFYLVGGTGLALQLGHRKSVDFDFYKKTSFNTDKIYQNLRKVIENIEIVQETEGSLTLRIEGIGVSMFHYEYPLIRPLIETEDILISSIHDIAAIKILTIIQRGSKRDFVDIYFMIKKFGLEDIIGFYCSKYEERANVYIALQALLYFDDAEKSEDGLRILNNEEIEWKVIKKEITQCVDNFRKEELI